MRRPRNRKAILESLKKHPEIWRLAERICGAERVSVDDALIFLVNKASSARARHRFLSTVRWSSEMSLHEVAGLIDVDHATVSYACERRQRELAREYTTASGHMRP